MRGNVMSKRVQGESVSPVSFALGGKQSVGMWQDIDLGWKSLAGTAYEPATGFSVDAGRTTGRGAKAARPAKATRSSKIDKTRVPRPRKNPNAS